MANAPVRVVNRWVQCDPGSLARTERLIVKDQETVARFIQLRAQGWTYDRFSTATRHIPNDEYFEDVLDWQVWKK